ncbi:MAG: hypothetical protein GWN77_06600, partial [Gammaproteobacteria bacterium]|nr:hypothetical protein [Gammaproteobacteria bacterium]
EVSRTLRDSTQTEVDLLDQLIGTHEGIDSRAYKLLEEFKQHANTVQEGMNEASTLAKDMKDWDTFIKETAD